MGVVLRKIKESTVKKMVGCRLGACNSDSGGRLLSAHSGCQGSFFPVVMIHSGFWDPGTLHLDPTSPRGAFLISGKFLSFPERNCLKRAN